MARKRLTQTERFAAVILDLKRGNGEPFISRGAAKDMTAQEIVDKFRSMTQDAHIVPDAIDGTCHPSNITVMETAQHLHETRTIDIPQIAKTKRLKKSHEEFRRKLLAKTLGQDVAEIATKPKGTIPSRPFASRDGMKFDWKTKQYKRG